MARTLIVHAPGAFDVGRCVYDVTPMSLELVREFCRSLADVGEDVKWGNDLVFTIGPKPRSSTRPRRTR